VGFPPGRVNDSRVYEVFSNHNTESDSKSMNFEEECELKDVSGGPALMRTVNLAFDEMRLAQVGFPLVSLYGFIYVNIDSLRFLLLFQEKSLDHFAKNRGHLWKNEDGYQCRKLLHISG